MNILPIYPKFSDMCWSFSIAPRFIGKKSAFSPHGLITVAAVLPEQFPICNKPFLKEHLLPA